MLLSDRDIKAPDSGRIQLDLLTGTWFSRPVRVALTVPPR